MNEFTRDEVRKNRLRAADMIRMLIGRGHPFRYDNWFIEADETVRGERVTGAIGAVMLAYLYHERGVSLEKAADILIKDRNYSGFGSQSAVGDEWAGLRRLGWKAEETLYDRHAKPDEILRILDPAHKPSEYPWEGK